MGGTQATSLQYTLQPKAIKVCVDRGEIPAEFAAPKPTRSQFYLGQDDAALRERFAKAGFTSISSWHVQCIWPSGGTGPGKAFAESWLSTNVDSVRLMEKLTPEQQASLL